MLHHEHVRGQQKNCVLINVTICSYKPMFLNCSADVLPGRHGKTWVHRWHQEAHSSILLCEWASKHDPPRAIDNGKRCQQTMRVLSVISDALLLKKTCLAWLLSSWQIAIRHKSCMDAKSLLVGRTVFIALSKLVIVAFIRKISPK